ncbi:MAG: polysaccharide deacetylase family protein [Lachnospiraceae bacterium]|nr:polysaccharide deacetylase family protein [Lachnospiraceae bacterium]
MSENYLEKGNKNRRNNMNNLLVILVAMSILLVVVLVAILFVELSGKGPAENDGDKTKTEIVQNGEKGNENKDPKINDEKDPGTEDAPATPTPSPTPVPAISVEEKRMLSLTPEKVEEVYGASVKKYGVMNYSKYVSGNVVVFTESPLVEDESLAKLISQAAEEAEKTGLEKINSMAVDLNPEESNLVVNYDSYANGVFVSVVYKITCETVKGAEKTLVTSYRPHVYNTLTKEEVAEEDFVKECYLPIIKERVAAHFIQEFETEAQNKGTTADAAIEAAQAKTFLDGATAYSAKDYTKFYVTDKELVFCFDKDALIKHDAFQYPVDLTEAKAFLKFELSDGAAKGPYIREDLDPNGKMIAFTFDDGPHIAREKEICDFFNEHNARATFFSNCGEERKGRYGSLTYLYNNGMEVASHTYNHCSFDSVGTSFAKYVNEDYSRYWYEVNMNTLAIAQYTGYAPDYVRYPGGQFKWEVDYDYLGKYACYPSINWTIDTEDWSKNNKEAYSPKDYAHTTDSAEVTETKVSKTVKTILDNAEDGAIILMHSIYQNSVTAAKRAVEELQAQGYQIVTVSELFYYKGITPENGKIYKSAKDAPQ